jgi:hypothetical protein
MRFYHCIIPNITILHLQSVGRKCENKKEKNIKSSNEATSVYTNVGVGISEGD